MTSTFLTRMPSRSVATLRYRNLGPDGVELRVQEEQSADAEIGHVTENVGFLAIESPLPDLPPPPPPPPAPPSLNALVTEPPPESDVT